MEPGEEVVEPLSNEGQEGSAPPDSAQEAPQDPVKQPGAVGCPGAFEKYKCTRLEGWEERFYVCFPYEPGPSWDAETSQAGEPQPGLRGEEYPPPFSKRRVLEQHLPVTRFRVPRQPAGVVYEVDQRPIYATYNVEDQRGYIDELLRAEDPVYTDEQKKRLGEIEAEEQRIQQAKMRLADSRRAELGARAEEAQDAGRNLVKTIEDSQEFTLSTTLDPGLDGEPNFVRVLSTPSRLVVQTHAQLVVCGVASLRPEKTIEYRSAGLPAFTVGCKFVELGEGCATVVDLSSYEVAYLPYARKAGVEILSTTPYCVFQGGNALLVSKGSLYLFLFDQMSFKYLTGAVFGDFTAKGAVLFYSRPSGITLLTPEGRGVELDTVTGVQTMFAVMQRQEGAGPPTCGLQAAFQFDFDKILVQTENSLFIYDGAASTFTCFGYFSKLGMRGCPIAMTDANLLVYDRVGQHINIYKSGCVIQRVFKFKSPLRVVNMFVTNQVQAVGSYDFDKLAAGAENALSDELKCVIEGLRQRYETPPGDSCQMI